MDIKQTAKNSPEVLKKSTTIQKPQKFYWGPLASILVPVIAYIFSQIILIVPVLMIFSANGGGEDTLNNSAWAGLALTGISAAGLLAVLWFYLKTKRLKFNSLGFKKLKGSDYGYTLLAGFLYLFLVGIVSAIATKVPGFNADQTQDIGYQNVLGWQLALAFIGLVIIPPIAEEMMFRGFLYRGLANNSWNKFLIISSSIIVAVIMLAFTANIIAPIFIAVIGVVSALLGAKFIRFGAALFTSMLFGLVHLQWNVAVDVFVLSLVLIALYEKTKNLWTCVILHALKNGLAFMFLFIFKL